jgi:AraC-like DNA-binding protein
MESATLSLHELRLAASSQQTFTPSTWGVLALREGAAAWNDPRHRRILNEGDVLILLPGLHGVLRVSEKAELVGEYFQFRPEELVGILSVDDRLLFDRANRNNGSVYFVNADTQFALKFQALSQRIGAPGTVEHRCQLLQLMAPLIEELRQIQQAGQPTTAAENRFVAILSQLTDSELQTLSVDDLARRCGCSRRHLSRLVRQRFGSSVVALKTQLRLERAAALLQDPTAKVIQVAYQCGFSHAGSFSARFKQRFGTTPAKWRLRVSAGSNGSSEGNSRDEIDRGRLPKHGRSKPPTPISRVLTS